MSHLDDDEVDAPPSSSGTGPGSLRLLTVGLVLGVTLVAFETTAVITALLGTPRVGV